MSATARAVLHNKNYDTVESPTVRLSAQHDKSKGERCNDVLSVDDAVAWQHL